MGMPRGIGVIDTLLAMPGDAGPVGGPDGDAVKRVLEQMDRCGIERAMLEVDFDRDAPRRALKDHPDRFFASYACDPNRGMDEVRRIVALYEAFGIKALSARPAGLLPQVPIDDKRFYPIYAKCVELGIPICCAVGVPRARVPMACQHVERVDEVCWFFPELTFVMRDGAEPWTDLAVKLLLKWPNLYYSTSACAPRHYPEAIVRYANTRGADKVLYAGGPPPDGSLESVFAELPDVPFRDPVWPKFLRDNALRVFGLDPGA